MLLAAGLPTRCTRKTHGPVADEIHEVTGENRLTVVREEDGRALALSGQGLFEFSDALPEFFDFGRLHV